MQEPVLYSKPFFSIITVCYNAEGLLPATIESLLAQTCTDYEYIIVDGASEDSTLEVLKKYESKIAKQISESDKGIYDAMNKGIDLAEGRYLYFLNAGDLFADDKVLEDIKRGIINNNFPDIVFGNVQLINKVKTQSATQERPNLDVTELFYKPINHQSIFAQKEILKSKFRTDIRVLSDYDWFLCSLQKEINIKHISRTVAVYDVTGFSGVNKNLLAEELKIIRKKYFTKYLCTFLPRLKGTKMMYLLKLKLVRRFLNKNLLKVSIKRNTIENV